MQPHTPDTARPRRSGARIAAIVAGGLAALAAVAMLAAGAALLWGDAQKDDRGYLATDSEQFSTSTHALVSEDLDVDLDGAGWIMDRDDYGNVRLEVTSRTDEPVFVGIAPTRDVSAYLRQTSHTLVTDVSYSPFEATYADLAERDGRTRPAPPAGERFWTASSHGTGPQTVTWDVDDGNWSIVVMNADGSRGVDAGISAGAKVPFLTALAWSTLGGGLLLLTIAAILVFLGVRRPGSRPAAPAPAATPAAA
jgi:hypothetical protein